MRQVFLEHGAIVVKEVSKPLLDDFSVLVMVHYSCISSGTEIATIANAKQLKLFGNVPQKVKKVLESIAVNGIDGTAALVKSKLQGQVQSLGYSCSGVVIAVGKKVQSLRTGDLVACAGAGLANHADIVCIPEHLAVKIQGQEFLKYASITTIGSIALQGIRRAQLQLGEIVCVIGLGLLGQLTIQLAKLSGCTVIGIDIIHERLQLAKKNGADAIYHATEDSVVNSIAYFTNHREADATIITASAKNNEIVKQSMEITRKKGRIVVVGDVGLGLERNPFYEKEIDFLISCSYGPGRYDSSYEQRGIDYPYAYVRWTENRNMQTFLSLIERKLINVGLLIEEEVSLEEIANAYETIQSKKGLGVFVRYMQHEQAQCNISPAVHDKQDTQSPKKLTFKPAKKDTLRVGIVGAGGFATVKLMPIIAKMKNAQINAIVDANINTSINASRQYTAARALVDDYELFQEDLVDVVVVSSPHKYHCEQALRALRKGKAVFMEKPMVTDFNQFDQLKDFLLHHPQMPFCVDYNRSFSPFIQKIKHELVDRSCPLMIQYRMNAGFIPKEHWIQTDIGAGRIIGEACHIFDLFCYLTDSKPVAVSVETLHTNDDNLFPTDNFNAQISFADGSVCSLLYTAIGHSSLGKERMEIFFDSKSIVMDDYEYLAGYGMPKSFDETVRTADKGHTTLLKLFFEQLSKTTFKHPISLERLCTVAQLTLVIDQLACEGGGQKEL